MKAAKIRDPLSNPSDDDLGHLVPETKTTTLTARDWEAFLAEWNHPGRPRPRLEEAIRRYQSHRQPDAG
jgi:hypothetical protein